MSEAKKDKHDWISEIGEPLPEDWEIVVTVRHGECSIELVDPQGEIVELCDDDLDVDEMLRLRVDHARVADGLGTHFFDEFAPPRERGMN